MAAPRSNQPRARLASTHLVEQARAILGATASRLGRATAVGRYVDGVNASIGQFLDELKGNPQNLMVPRFGGAKRHLLSSPGKMVRPLIVSMLGRALDVGADTLRPYSVAVELIHVSSLLHDDVIDRSDRRRHRPTANAEYDNTLPVLAGDSILAEVMERIAALDDLGAIKAIAATIQDLVTGEAWQYEMRGVAHDDLQVCLEVAELKTGALLSLCTWLPAHLAGRPDDEKQGWAEIGRFTGVSFQLIDDLLDVLGEQSGKPLLGDWAEAKTNAVTAVLLRLHPAARPRLQELFSSDDEDRSAARLAALLHELFPGPVIEEAAAEIRRLAEEYAALAEERSRLVPDNESGRLFQQLRQMLLSRKA